MFVCWFVLFVGSVLFYFEFVVDYECIVAVSTVCICSVDLCLVCYFVSDYEDIVVCCYRLSMIVFFVFFLFFFFFFFFKQKTSYELRISDWSSDVCSSD